MTTFTSEDREMAAKHDGIESPHNACCYRDQCRQQQAEIEALKEKLDEAEQRYWNNNMKPNELADAVKSIYIGNPLAPTEFLMAIEATLRGQQSQIEILKIQISNLDLENIALNEQLESYLFK